MESLCRSTAQPTRPRHGRKLFLQPVIQRMLPHQPLGLPPDGLHEVVPHRRASRADHEHRRTVLQDMLIGRAIRHARDIQADRL